jgi:hypothetical protein
MHCCIDRSLSGGTNITAGSYTLEGYWDMSSFVDFKVFKEHTTTLYPTEGAVLSLVGNTAGGNISMTADIQNLAYQIYAPDTETIHVDEFAPRILVHVDLTANTTGYNVTHWYFEITYRSEGHLYTEEIGGRYEWVVVGRDSKPVDSVGSALVSAAFKNKQVEIGNGALDMVFNESTLQSVPNVMNEFGTSNEWADYYKLSDPPASTPGNRTALIDDWCTYWPVTTSNMIAVGGPLINLLTYYSNDFMQAFYGIPGYTPYGPWNGAVAAASCWSRDGYYSSESTGYAAISTYQDLNGTVIFSVWGVWGRDSFYASQWLDGDAARMPETTYTLNNGTKVTFPLTGIQYLQQVNKGITSIILKIDYTDAKHPEFEVVEHLGTISEKIPIHPDP